MLPGDQGAVSQGSAPEPTGRKRFSAEQTRFDVSVSVAILLLAALLLVNGVVCYRNTWLVYRDGTEVARAHELLAAAATLRADLRRMEAAQRTVLLTDQWSEDYQRGELAVRRSLEALKVQTAPEAALLGPVRDLQGVVDAGIARLKLTLDVKQGEGDGAAQELVAQGETRRLMGEAERVIEYIERQVYAQLEVRRRATQLEYANAQAFGVACAACGLSAVAGLAWVLRRSMQARARSSATIRNERERLQSTLQSIGDGVIATDLDGKVTFLNGVAERLTGWPLSAAVSCPLTEVFRIVNESSRAEVENPALRALHDGVIVGLANHTLLIARDGVERPIDDSAAPIRDRSGDVTGAVLVFRDITERKLAEAERTHLAEALALAVSAADLGTWEWDPVTDAVQLSARAGEIYGADLRVPQTRESLRLLIDPVDRERARDETRRSVADRTDYAVEYRLLTGRWVSVRGRGVYNADGTLSRMLGILQDIHERRQAEQTLRVSERRHRLVVELSRATQSISDPAEIMAVSARLLAEQLGADRCAYAEVENEATYQIFGDYAAQLPSIVGRWPLSSFGNEHIKAMRAGETYVVTDASSDWRIGEIEQQAFEATQIRAVICHPLLKNGVLIAAMAVHQARPRLWTPEEIDLVATVSEGCWGTLERVRVDRALRKSESLYRAMIEATPQCVKLLAPDGALLQMNAAGLEMIEADVAPLGRPIFDLLAPEDVPRYRAFHERICRGERGTLQFDSIGLKGTRRHMETFAVPLPNEDGTFLSLSVTLDVTQRRRAEAALQESNERFTTVARATNDAVWDWDLRTDRIWWNEGVTTLFGHPRELVREDAQWWYDHIHPEDRERVQSSVRDVIDQRRVNWSDEYRFLKADGSYSEVLDRGYAIRVDDLTVRLVGAMQDVTAQRHTEAALRSSEAQFRSLFESMEEGYCVVEPVFDEMGQPLDYRYLLANPALETQTGLRDVVGKTALQVMPTHEREWIEAYARVALTGQPFEKTDWVMDLNRWYEVSAFRVGDAADRQVGVLFADVTARVHAEAALRASEQRLVEVFQHAPAFMAVLRGPDHVFERANRRYIDLVGGRSVVGRSVREALPEVVEQGFIELLDRVFQTGTPYIGRDTRVTLRSAADGTADVRHLDFVYQPLRSPSGEVEGVVVQGIDLTERVRAEQALRERDARLQVFLSAATDYAVIISDPQGRIVEWLGGAEAITGYQAADAVGATHDLIFTKEDRDAGVPEGELQAAAANGRVDDKRWHVRKGGDEFFADGVMVSLRDDDGELRGFGKVFRDATAVKRAEDSVRFLADASASLAELVDYQSTLQRIASIAVLGFADWCLVDLIEEGQSRRLAMTRATSEDAAGVSKRDLPLELLQPQTLLTSEPEVVSDLSDLNSGAMALDSRRAELLRGLGVSSYLIVPLTSRERFIGSMTFISQSPRRRFAANELRVGMDLAARVSAAIENAHLYHSLQEQDRRKDEFLATLAHELRNPLAPVRSGVQILRATVPKDERSERALVMMDRQLGHMVHLVDDLLDVARVSIGKVVLRKERVELRAIVDAAVESTRQAIDASEHTLIVDVQNGPLLLDGDRTRLVQVLSNLLSNAAKYTPNRGQIRLSATSEDGLAVVRVSDNGVGISAEMLPKVFEIFTQVGTSLERAQGGLGIGLTLVKRLVEMHGGTVAAVSDGPGQGSTFTVCLPVVSGVFPTEEARTQSKGAATGRLKVLVVDDNRDAAESLGMLLELKGHEVLTANDGPEALKVLGVFRPQLILLDLGLPGMTGFDVARRIRESPQLEGVTLAALTGWGQEEDRRRTREAGFDHHLTKPADPGVVDAILAEIAQAST